MKAKKSKKDVGNENTEIALVELYDLILQELFCVQAVSRQRRKPDKFLSLFKRHVALDKLQSNVVYTFQKCRSNDPCLN
jgi:hypothetical protein